ncbi:hypothetical protein N7509_008688 [Penicillium cosmopolitanum]|uniref:Sterol 3-beta-glucosyltransferase n=1 Tax=Penicillium cosmopolitanum TaxID=1131564 RepID=A0A9W9VN26_9EURO|nr:uncharacterized protein N7509_008688 [Penicillium cosmopolitanum]KAJ5386147.1 hypothetical protein N7509_008688 [Penicillium cosmopolitanum]
MKPSIDDAKRRGDHRLSASMRPTTSTHRYSSDRLPERFKDGDDAQVDYTAPPGHGLSGWQRSLHAAVAFWHDRRSRLSVRLSRLQAEQTRPTDSNPAKVQKQRLQMGVEGDNIEEQRLRTNYCGKFRGLGRKERTDDPSNLSASTLTIQPRRTRSATPRAAPILTRMVQAQSRFDNATSTEITPSRPETPNEDREESSIPALSIRLMEMFGFERPEKVLVEYACSFLQSMLLPGYMYVTEGHICFYAYLPKKSSEPSKSGYVSKRGRKNPKYNRYWFVLKGDVFSYYADPSNLYFPSGHVDLRYGISASLLEPKTDGTDAKDFQVTTDQRTYYFRADSATSAKEWVKALQKVIFRSHNKEDSVKISFPIENVIDLEESPMVEFAETFKVRVIDSAETFAIDEVSPRVPPSSKYLLTSSKYFFSFFNSGQDAFNYLRSLVTSSPAKNMQEESPNKSDGKGRLVSSTFDMAHSRRRSVSVDNDLKGSADSFAHSADQGTESSRVVQSLTETTESASQILNRSDVFQSPTMHSLPRRSSDVGEVARRRSDDTARSATARLSHAAHLAGSNYQDRNDENIPFVSGSENQQMMHSQYHSNVPLNDLVKAGAYPLQRAAGFAEYLRSRSKQMSSLLATESMGYIEKVSGMWAGGQRHYGETEEVLPDDKTADPEDHESGLNHGDRFRGHFGLPTTERLQATYYAYLHRVLPLYGKIYLSERKLCFRSLIPGTRTKMILPLRDIENVEKEKGFRFGYHGLVVIIRGHEELFFEFKSAGARDDCAVTLHQDLESVKFLMESGMLAEEEREEVEAAKDEHRLLQEARLDGPEEHDFRPTLSEDSSEVNPFFDDTRASIINFKPTESLKITCLTIGSRGDVQPYIALCKGLLAEGHKPKIATHAEFEPWIRKHGIDFAPVDGDPAELMRICVENGMFTYSFLREASVKFRGWIDDLLSSSWASCQGSDLLIESPSAMAGIHIAEALRIPYFRGFTMPWTRTRAYPHAFAVPENRMGGAYNYITYVMFDNIFWKAIAGQVNRWRNNELGLKGTSLDKMQPNKVPFLYNYSPSVVPPPLDYPDWIRITGYWFLNEGSDWTPPADLANFIARARADGKKIVYIGFGSIVVSDPAALTKTVIQSVQKADVRCILSKGWSDRLGDPSSVKAEVPLPPEIFQIQAAPHDWLFSQIDAAAHHGGAGTTGASLRAGVPTIVKPFFGDQFFFGGRVEDLGVGICMKRLNVSVFSRALWEATHSERMIVKARNMGIQIRNEDGVATAIQSLYRDLEYAKTLAKQRSIASSTPFSPTPSARAAPHHDDDDDDDIEEWTFVSDVEKLTPGIFK